LRIARIEHQTPDGAEARIVVAGPDGWNDVRTVERQKEEEWNASGQERRHAA
jgi:hypothetical protein